MPGPVVKGALLFITSHFPDVFAHSDHSCDALWARGFHGPIYSAAAIRAKACGQFTFVALRTEVEFGHFYATGIPLHMASDVDTLSGNVRRSIFETNEEAETLGLPLGHCGSGRPEEPDGHGMTTAQQAANRRWHKASRRATAAPPHNTRLGESRG